MHPIQHRPDLGRSKVLGRVSVRHRIRPTQAHEFSREEAIVLRLRPSDAPESQSVLGKSKMAHLPCDVADTSGRLPKPLRGWCLIEKPDSALAAKHVLSRGKSQACTV